MYYIKSLTLSNFHTYTHAKFNFRPGLNYILALNGSGKSAISFALAFVFDEHRLLKRQNVDFLRFGCEFGYAEVELAYHKSENKAKVDKTTSIKEINTDEDKLNELDIAKSDDKPDDINASIFNKGNYYLINAEEDKIIKFFRDHNLNSDEFKKNKSFTIKRTLTPTKTQYFFNNNSSTRVVVKELLSVLNIDFSNPTQFLPQDRIINFTKISPKDLFKEILNCIDPTITVIKQEIQLKESDLDSLLIREKEISIKAGGTEQVLINLKEEVEKDEVRTAAVAKLKLLNYKLMYLEYEENLNNKKRIESDIKASEGGIESFKSEMVVLQKAIDDFVNCEEFMVLSRYVEMIKEDNKGLKIWADKLKEVDSLLKKKEFEKMDVKRKKLRRDNDLTEYREKIKEIEERLNNKIEWELLGITEGFEAFFTSCIRRSRNSFLNEDDWKMKDFIEDVIVKGREVFEDKISNFKVKEINKNNNDFSIFSEQRNNVADEFIYPTQFLAHCNKLLTLIEESLNTKKINLKRNRLTLEDKSRQLHVRITELDKQKLLESQLELQKLEKLQKISIDTYKAIKYLKTTSYNYLEPAYLSVTIEEKYINLIESFLGFRLCTSILVFDKNEFREISRKLKDEMKLNVNIVLYERNVNDLKGINIKNRRSFTEDFRNKFGDQDDKENNDKNIETQKTVILYKSYTDYYKKLGFDGTVIDFIHGHPVHKDFFCSLSNLNQIPVGFVDESVLKVNKIRKAVINNKFVDTKISKYSKDVLMIESVLNRTYWFDLKSNFDKKEFEKLKAEREEMHKKNNELLRMERELEEFLKLMTPVKGEYNMMKIKVKEEEKRKRNDMEKVRKYNDEIKRLKNLKFNVEDLEKEHKKIVNEVELINKEIKKYMLGDNKKDKSNKDGNKKVKRTVKGNDKMQDLTFYEILKNYYKVYESIKVIEMSKIRAEEKIQTAKFNIDCLEKNIVQNKEMLINVKIKIKSLKGSLKKVKDLKGLDLLPDTKHEIEVEIFTQKNIIKSIKVDEKALSEYKERKDKLKTIETQRKNLEAKIKTLKEEIDIKKSQLMELLDGKITRLSERFTYFFTRIGCKGKIQLNKDGNISEWSLNILVSFRENEELTLLNAFRQSGGEKSVSICLFLLALQNVSNAPIKLMDEINQGMDKKNEQMVMELLAESVGDYQYFVISPKIAKFDVNKCNVVVVYKMGVDVKELNEIVKRDKAFS